MKQFKDAFSDGDAYESNDSEGIYTAGIDMPFNAGSKLINRHSDNTWHSRIEIHGESKEEAEALRDAVLAAINPTQPEDMIDPVLIEVSIPGELGKTIRFVERKWL